MHAPHRLVLGGILLAVASACVASPPPTGVPTAPPKHRVASRPPASPSSDPTASATPPSIGPTATPTATPSAALPSLAPADLRLARIEASLLLIAQVDFGQNRGRLAADRVFDGAAGAALIGNNGAGVISNNGSGIVSDHGGGLVGGLPANLVSNNGAGIISDHGGGYRLAAAAPELVITDVPAAGETLVADRLGPDDVRTRQYQAKTPAGFPATRLVASRDHTPFFERQRDILGFHAGDVPNGYHEVVVEMLGAGRFAYRQDSVTTLDEAAKTIRSAVGPGSFFIDKATGGVIYMDEFTYETATRTGRFHYRYAAFGLEETGTLADMKIDGRGSAAYAPWDPLEIDDGDSQLLDPTGRILIAKRQRTVGAERRRTYDLGDGVGLSLVRQTAERWEGTMSEAGQAVATVVQDTRADGSSVFVVTFAERADRPLTIGYGVKDSVSAARPTQPPRWLVKAVAGAAEAGHVNGPGAEARFNQPAGLAPARTVAGRLFLADTANHRLRVLSSTGGITVADFVGTGEAGSLDGPAAEARFKSPYAIAVGADDTVYVSDIDDHRIRVVAPDGHVTTLAGTGEPGFIDGPPGTGRLAFPTGLALDPAGRLYVAEHGNHAIRRIETVGEDRGAITTVVGGGPGPGAFADGPADTARFNSPRGLAFGPDGALYVADHDNRRIRRVASDLSVTTFAGSDLAAHRYFDGPATEAYFNPPRALAFGPDGTLFFSTPLDLFYVTPAGELRSYAGSGIKGLSDGVAAFATFTDVQGLYRSSSGTLYILDENRLRAVVPPAVP